MVKIAQESAVPWRKLGRRSHTDVVVKLGKDSRMVERVGDEASWPLGLSTTRKRRAGIVERIDSGS